MNLSHYDSLDMDDLLEEMQSMHEEEKPVIRRMKKDPVFREKGKQDKNKLREMKRNQENDYDYG